MKDWGRVIESLLVAIRAAGTRAYSECYGTPKYFVTRNLYTHRSFDRWCGENGISPELRGKFLDEVKKYSISYTPPGICHLQILWKTLPDEFNVRGAWTSEFLR